MLSRRSFIASLTGLLIPSATFGDDLYKPTGRYAAATEPRIPRVIAFVSANCPPCKTALGNGPTSFPLWLAEAGWDVGSDDRSHVQIVDVDANPALADQFFVTTVPAVVLVDGTKRRAIPYRDRQTIVDLLKPQVSAKPHTVNVGRHSHTCPRCNVTWSHNDGDPRASHTCPSCGRQVTIQSSHWTQAVEVAAPKPKPVAVGLPVFKSGVVSGCPTCRMGQ